MEVGQASVPAAHRQATLQLMEIFAMEMGQAFRYLKSMNYDLENAIAMKLNPQPTNLPHNRLMGYQFQQDSQEEAQKLKALAREFGSKKSNNKNDRLNGYVQKKDYNKTYLIKKIKSPKKGKNSKKKQEVNSQKILQQFDFNGELSKLIESEVYVSIIPDVYDAFQQLWDERKLLAIHCIKFLKKQQLKPQFQQIIDYTKEIYKNASFVQTFNKYLINFGLDPNHFDFNFYPFMKEFIKEGDQYSIIVLRYNENISKVQLVQKLPFSQTFKFSAPLQFQNLIKRLQKDKNYLMHKTEKQSSSEKKRIQEDRQIRQQQQIEYYKQLNTAQNQIEKVSQAVQTIDLSDIRRKNRELLTVYPEDIEDAIDFKVRLPNSEAIYFKLPRTQTVEYIFKAIENYENDLGFNDEVDRKFDIIVPLERISLSDKKKETFLSLFGKSEMESLAVKQI